jgi:hypothetical protein
MLFMRRRCRICAFPKKFLLGRVVAAAEGVEVEIILFRRQISLSKVMDLASTTSTPSGEVQEETGYFLLRQTVAYLPDTLLVAQ